MRECLICGDECQKQPVSRHWSPDDGWQLGRLCPACSRVQSKRRPEPSDYAWDKRGEFVSDTEQAIDQLFG